MKVLFFIGVLSSIFILGDCLFLSDTDLNNKIKNYSSLIRFNSKDDFNDVKVDNIKLNMMNNNDLKKQYHCSVTEGISLPVDWVRGGHAGGKVQNQIVIAGGNSWSKDKTIKYWLKSTIVFNDGKWIEGPELPKPLAFPMFGYDNTGFYIAGGTSDGIIASKDVYRLTSLENGAEWAVLPQLPEAVFYGAGVVFKNKFYVTCGYSGNEQTNAMWVLDIENPENGWTECSSVPGVARMFPAFTTCGEYLYLIGGLETFSPLTPLNDIYRYCPRSDEWVRLGDLSLKGYAWVAKPIDENHIIITGRADGVVHDDIWIVDVRDSSMKKAGNLILSSTTAPLVEVNDDCFWLIAGEPDPNKNRTEKVSVIRIHSK